MTVSTSENNPLRVDWLGDPPGTIGLTIAPGKVGTMLGRQHRRNLRTDLQAVKAAGADVLVNLMETDEMQRWQMQEYFAAAQDLGLETVHFPIRDMDVPTDLGAFRQLVQTLDARVQQGHRVAIHCLGGLGRSGTLAACLLVEGGKGAHDAAQLVRDFRSGAIQTAAQEKLVHSYAAMP